LRVSSPFQWLVGPVYLHFSLPPKRLRFSSACPASSSPPPKFFLLCNNPPSLPFDCHLRNHHVSPPFCSFFSPQYLLMHFEHFLSTFVVNTPIPIVIRALFQLANPLCTFERHFSLFSFPPRGFAEIGPGPPYH